MSHQSTRKRDQLARLFRRKSSQSIPTTPSTGSLVLATSGFARSPATHGTAGAQSERKYSEILSSIRTVLELADSVFDGCPIWGPKAAVSVAAKGVKALQTSLANEESIGDIMETVQKTVDLLAPSMPILPSTVSPDLRFRISAHISELERIRSSIAQWAEEEKTMARRVLDAERVATELEGVMSKIHAANERFLMETSVKTEAKADAINRTVATLEERDLLDRLQPVKEAFHNAPNASEMCLAGTRQQLLADLFAWFDDITPSRERVFWLNGLAGTGKTTVARTIAARAHEQGRLAAAFFFSRNIAATRSPSAILPTIAYQLAHYQRPFRTAVCTAVGADEDVRDRGIATQADVLFSHLRDDAAPNSPILIVLDALDECYLENGCEGGDAVPLLLAQFASVPSVKILITSRMDDTIKHMLDRATNRLTLHDIEADIVQSDIMHYLRHTLEKCARMRRLSSPFPTDSDLSQLVKRAGTLFIYAVTVVKWVSDPKAEPNLRLRQVLNQDADEIAFQHKLLDGMYLQILTEAAQTSGNPTLHERSLKNILSTVVLLQEPTNMSALASLAGEDARTSAILPLLSAVLLVDETVPVRLFHPSFPDFISDRARCSDKRFLVMRPEGHLRLAIRCLEIMNTSLRENICDLQDPSMSNSDVVDLELRLDQAVSSELRYASRYWHIHVRSANGTSPDLVKCLKIFCALHLLHWIELLSLLDDVERLAGSNSMQSLQTYLEGCKALQGSSIHALLSDVARLVVSYSTPIRANALHVYHSALATMPSCQLHRKVSRHHSDIPLLISERPSRWGPRAKLIYYHASPVASAAFSADGLSTVSGACDGTLQLWDISLGTQQLVVQGHSSPVTSIAFSPDGQYIVSGSEDSRIHVWSTSTGAQCHAITGHKGSVLSVAFSPDGHFVVSGSSDRKVQVWNLLSSEQRCVMSGHERSVFSVAFSPDGQSIASGSRDHTVRVWDAVDGTQHHIMKGHQGSVLSVIFSPDGHWIASGSSDSTLRVWDATTGSLAHIKEKCIDRASCVAFSPDCQSIVTAFSSDRVLSVQVLDTVTGTSRYLLSAFDCHPKSVCFLPDRGVMVCSSTDRTAQVWEVTSVTDLGDQRRTLAGHKHIVYSVTCSSNGRYMISSSGDHTIRVWDTTTGAQRHVISGHNAPVYDAAFSSNCHWIVSASEDCTVRIWDVAAGAHRHTMKGHTDAVRVAAFSHDSRSVISGSFDRTVRLWNATTGHQRHVMIGHSGAVSAVAFSRDRRLVVSGSADKTIRLWDTVTGTQQHIMLGHTDAVRSVALSPNGQFIVSGSRDQTVRVWDAMTGAHRHKMNHDDKVQSVAFLSDSNVVISRSVNNVRDWDAATGEPLTVTLAQQDISVRARQQTIMTQPLFRLDADGWISRRSMQGCWQRVCWLTPERRGFNLGTCGQKVCIGAYDGAITIMDFSHANAARCDV